MLSGLKTHLTALVGLIVAALVAFGVITPDSEQELTKAIIETLNIGFGLVIAVQSVIAIFQRMATAKVEKKADTAEKAAKSTQSTVMAAKLGLLIVCAMALPMLSACTAGSKLGEIITNPDGKPVVSGIICVNTPNGQFCYVPENEVIVKPEVVPDPSAAVPSTTLMGGVPVPLSPVTPVLPPPVPPPPAK